MDLHSSAYQLSQGLTFIGIDLLILLVSRYLARRQDNLIRLVYKTWLNTFVFGLLVCVVIGLISSNDISSAIYNAMLPILRNSYPIIVGILLGTIIGKEVLNKLNVETQHHVGWGIVALITAGMVVAPNAYGWASGTYVLFYTLLSVLGWQSVRCPLFKLSRKWWCLLGLGALVINSSLQVIMPFSSIDGSTMARFTTPASIFTVIIAISLVEIFAQKLAPVSLAFIFSYQTLAESSAILTYLNDGIRTKIGDSSVQNFLVALVVIVIALVVSWLWEIILKRVKLCQRVNHGIDHFTQQSFVDQLRQGQKWFQGHWADFVAFAVSYLIALIAMISIADSLKISINNKNYFIITYALGQRQLMLLLTAVIIYFGIKLLQVITRRYWVSMALVVIFNIIFIVGTHEKDVTRSEPVLPSDLSALNMELLKMVDAKVYIAVGIAILLIIVLVVYLERTFPVKITASWQAQVVDVLVLPLIFASALFWNQSGKPLSNFMTSIGDQPTFYSQLDGARRNGPTIQFMNNMDVEVMEEPSGYSRKAVLAVVKRYQKEAKTINRHRTNTLSKQTIIFNLSESFANPNRVPGVKLAQDPIPYINQLKKTTTSGLMISSGYGGGTANMEYMTLTGNAISNFLATMSVPYTQLVPRLKNNPSIVDSFKHSVAIHPYYGVFYSRIGDYKKFGFNKFYYIGSKYKIKHQYKIDRSAYLSDKTAYANVLDQIKGYKNGQFINLITMQNHLPFDQNYYNDLKKYEAKSVSSGTDANSLNDYVTGIHYTDNYVKAFIKQIDKINKPITIVFYGDHLPGIYSNNMATDGLKLHETDYFIYSNKYARQHGARNLKTATKFVDPNDFIAMVAKQTNSKVNWYQALLTGAYEKLPAVSLPTNQTGSDSNTDRNQFVNQKGQIVSQSSFTKKQKQLWHDYQLIQYDVTSGNHYSIKYFK